MKAEIVKDSVLRVVHGLIQKEELGNRLDRIG
jgi:hypothetical protein